MVAQPLERLVVLDAFGDDDVAEVVRELDNRPDDRRVRIVVEQVGDEASVDLQLVQRQLREVPERGLTAAEVVDADGDAGRRKAYQVVASPA